MRPTPDDKQRIVELRLQGVPVRHVAEQVGTTTTTVQRTWHKWLSETAEQRAETMESVREALMQRLEQIADDARRSMMRARADNDHGAAARWLAEERQALRELARIQGFDVQRVEHSGRTDTTVEFVWREEIVKPGGE